MTADTAARSLAHWSEAGRAGMQAFYALATEDYRQLAGARDWADDLRSRATGGRVRLLDVACGSGKFPAALLATGLAERARDLTIEVDLLDPSAFSLTEARRVLAPPFVGGADHQVGVQAMDPSLAPYDVVWATHALYALPPVELAAAGHRLASAVRPGGLGAVAQATSRSHYLAFYEAYRCALAPDATPYTTAEQVAEALRGAGARPAVQVLTYRTGSSDRAVVEGFLQRCAFDDSVSLGQLEAAGPLGDYLAGCRDAIGGYVFDHEVQLLTWSGEAS